LVCPLLGWGVFFLFPLLTVLKISLAQSVIGTPPYMPLLTNSGEGIKIHATLASFVPLAGDGLYVREYLGALGNAALATALCLVFGYPIAHAIARTPATWRGLLLFPVILPFWTSFLIRVCAWIAILKPNGLLNGLLITTPLPLLNNNFSVELGPVYSYLPFMILPLYGSLSALDESLIEAAADLGARPFRAFLRDSCFVAVLVRAQLAGFDRSLEEAALSSAHAHGQCWHGSRCRASARLWLRAGS
jgi:putrescine transport system permease protein